jgi:hypothetical protein
MSMDTVIVYKKEGMIRSVQAKVAELFYLGNILSIMSEHSSQIIYPVDNYYPVPSVGDFPIHNAMQNGPLTMWVLH